MQSTLLDKSVFLCKSLAIVRDHTRMALYCACAFRLVRFSVCLPGPRTRVLTPGWLCTVRAPSGWSVSASASRGLVRVCSHRDGSVLYVRLQVGPFQHLPPEASYACAHTGIALYCACTFRLVRFSVCLPRPRTRVLTPGWLCTARAPSGWSVSASLPAAGRGPPRTCAGTPPRPGARTSRAASAPSGPATSADASTSGAGRRPTCRDGAP